MVAVRDLMSTDLFTIRADKKVIAVSEIMNWARVRHVPVVDEHGALVGMLSHRDLLRVSWSTLNGLSASEARLQMSQVPITSVMTEAVSTVTPDASVAEAARLMRHHKIGALPVLDDGTLVGIITEYDLLELVEQMT